MGTEFTHAGRPIPLPNPTTQPFFDATREERLLLPCCPRDGFFFYPRSHCPACLRDDWSWKEASGRGEVHAFTIDRHGHDPALAAQAPFAIAVIELEEGPRMTAGIRECELSEVHVGLAVQATYEHLEPDPDGDPVTLVHFRPRA